LKDWGQVAKNEQYLHYIFYECSITAAAEEEKWVVCIIITPGHKEVHKCILQSRKGSKSFQIVRCNLWMALNLI
jgi:hypothetical protein